MSEILEKNAEEVIGEPLEETKNETLEENSKPYNVLLGGDGYYTGNACFTKYSRFDSGVDVETLPEETDALKMRCYKLENDTWVFDEEHYTELLNTPSEEPEPTPTTSEEIAALKEQVSLLTGCILELSSLLYE